MTDQQVLQALDIYEQMLKARGAEPIEVPHNRYPASHEEARNHALAKIPQIRQLLTGDNREKLMRWLGFVQGVLWSPPSLFTVNELKDHNR